MKLLNPKFFLAVLFMFAGQAAFAETRIGVVNTIKLMSKAPLAQAAQKQIETEFAPREKELIGIKKKLRSLEEQLTRDGAIMSEGESKKLERSIITKRREFKRLNDEFQEDLNIRNNEILSKLQTQINDALKALAKEKKFDIILGQGVLYASDAVDITDQVLAKLK
ncbi:MAG: OmpH family outer membrane protein [Gammaproteobacteria bacterium]